MIGDKGFQEAMYSLHCFRVNLTEENFRGALVKEGVNAENAEYLYNKFKATYDGDFVRFWSYLDLSNRRVFANIILKQTYRKV